MNTRKAAKLAVALFFAVLTILGLLVCGDYGVPTDAYWERQTLQENMHEYAACLGMAEADAWYSQRGIGLISQSTEKDHGQAAYYLFMPLLERFEQAPQQLNLLWQGYTWLWFMAGVWALYAFAHETGLNRPTSCLATLLLYLCPRFFAEGHYNNKDMVLLSLVLCTLWLGVRFLKQPGFVRGMLFSLAGALAANAKIAGAFAWAVMGLCAVVMVTADRRWSARMAAVAGVAIGTFAAVYALLTPALWADPAGYVQYLLQNASGFTRWTGVVVFRDMLFDQAVQPLPRYYLIWMMVVTLPLCVLPLAAAGQLELLRQLGKQKARALADPISLALIAASLCWFVPLLMAVVMQPTVYNGWRHFYFVYAGIVVLAAHGIRACMRLGRYVGGDCGMHLVFVAGLVLFFGWTARDIAREHPYQYAYYNRLGHGDAAHAMELDYWNVSAKNALEALLESERDESLPLVLGAQEPMSWFGVADAYQVLAQEQQQRLIIEEDAQAPYLFSNATYARIYGTQAPTGYHELLSLDSYDIPICTIYERDR